MATWNSRTPLRIPRYAGKDRTKKKPGKLTYTDIKRGEVVPDELLTEQFIGGALNQLTNLTQQDQALLAAWREHNPRVAARWAYLDRTPTFREVHVTGGSMNGGNDTPPREN